MAEEFNTFHFYKIQALRTEAISSSDSRVDVYIQSR